MSDAFNSIVSAANDFDGTFSYDTAYLSDYFDGDYATDFADDPEASYFENANNIYSELSKIVPDEILTHTGTFGTNWATYYTQPWFTTYLSYLSSIADEGLFSVPFAFGDEGSFTDAMMATETDDSAQAAETSDDSAETDDSDSSSTAESKTSSKSATSKSSASSSSATSDSGSSESSSSADSEDSGDSESSSSDAANNLYVPLGVVGLAAIALL